MLPTVEAIDPYLLKKRSPIWEWPVLTGLFEAAGCTVRIAPDITPMHDHRLLPFRFASAGRFSVANRPIWFTVDCSNYPNMIQRNDHPEDWRGPAFKVQYTGQHEQQDVIPLAPWGFRNMEAYESAHSVEPVSLPGDAAPTARGIPARGVRLPGSRGPGTDVFYYDRRMDEFDRRKDAWDVYKKLSGYRKKNLKPMPQQDWWAAAKAALATVHISGTWPGQVERSHVELFSLGLCCITEPLVTYCGAGKAPVAWEHYVPIEGGVLDGLAPAIQWCADNPEDCKTIGKNSQEFYETYLRPEALFKHMFDCMTQWVEERRAG